MAAVLDCVTRGMHELARCIYQGTGHEVRAVGIALDADLFDRAAIMWVDSLALPKAGAEAMLLRIREDGAFEGTISGTPVRIAREDV